MTGQDRQQQTEADGGFVCGECGEAEDGHTPSCAWGPNAETRWTAAARRRLAGLERHPGHDGPTVCACVECVLVTLLECAFTEVEFTAARLSGLQDTLAAKDRRIARLTFSRDMFRHRVALSSRVHNHVDHHAACHAYLDLLAQEPYPGALALNADGANGIMHGPRNPEAAALAPEIHGGPPAAPPEPHDHARFTQGLWAATEDDSTDEPPDFDANDGMDDVPATDTESK